MSATEVWPASRSRPGRRRLPPKTEAPAARVRPPGGGRDLAMIDVPLRHARPMALPDRAALLLDGDTWTSRRRAGLAGSRAREAEGAFATEGRRVPGIEVPPDSRSDRHGTVAELTPG